jgi:transposase-like protein
MSVQRRRFSEEFKLQVVQEVLAGDSQASVARRHSVSANTILQLQVAELQRLVGKKEEQIEFLKKTARHWEQRNAVTPSPISGVPSRRKKDAR